jgi:hypothetical protein
MDSFGRRPCPAASRDGPPSPPPIAANIGTRWWSQPDGQYAAVGEFHVFCSTLFFGKRVGKLASILSCRRVQGVGTDKLPEVSFDDDQ